MEESTKFDPTLKFFLTLGCLGALAMIIIPFALVTYLGMEYERWSVCSNRSPKDQGCESGRMWKYFEKF